MQRQLDQTLEEWFGQMCVRMCEVIRGSTKPLATPTMLCSIYLVSQMETEGTPQLLDPCATIADFFASLSRVVL